VALLLRKKGVKRIRPLEGGLDGWRERGYPLENVPVGGEPEEISKV
jgi:3-mercaptopyruvate sulfurtransferase SseA